MARFLTSMECAGRAKRWVGEFIGSRGPPANERKRVIICNYLVISSLLDRARLQVVHGIGRAGGVVGFGVPALAGETLTFPRRSDLRSGAWPAEAGTPNQGTAN